MQLVPSSGSAHSFLQLRAVVLSTAQRLADKTWRGRELRFAHDKESAGVKRSLPICCGCPCLHAGLQCQAHRSVLAILCLARGQLIFAGSCTGDKSLAVARARCRIWDVCAIRDGDHNGHPLVSYDSGINLSASACICRPPARYLRIHEFSFWSIFDASDSRGPVVLHHYCPG